jgi:ribokinase
MDYMGNVLVTGAINWDINLFIQRFPSVGEEISIQRIMRVPGGTGANVSVAAARLLKRGNVVFIGGLGTDSMGETQITILQDEGVNASAIKSIEREESGQAYITIDENGYNCIYTYFGANLQLLPEDLTEPQRLDFIQKAKIIVIMDPPLATAEKLAELGRASNATIIWDPGVYWALGLKALTRTLAKTDYFILNHIEFKNLLGTNEPKAIGEKLGEIRSDLTVVMKQGAKGSTLIKERGSYVTMFPSIQLEKMGLKVMNTVGCGDAFIGSFAASMVHGLSDDVTVKRANYAGAFKATRSETRGSPTKTELDAFIKKVMTIIDRSTSKVVS